MTQRVNAVQKPAQLDPQDYKLTADAAMNPDSHSPANADATPPARQRPEASAKFNLSRWALEHPALTLYLTLMVPGFAAYFQLAQPDQQNVVESAGVLQTTQDVLQAGVSGQFDSLEQLRAMPLRA